jgi:hypothetical protein
MNLSSSDGARDRWATYKKIEIFSFLILISFFYCIIAFIVFWILLRFAFSWATPRRGKSNYHMMRFLVQVGIMGGMGQLFLFWMEE